MKLLRGRRQGFVHLVAVAIVAVILTVMFITVINLPRYQYAIGGKVTNEVVRLGDDVMVKYDIVY